MSASSTQPANAPDELPIRSQKHIQTWRQTIVPPDQYAVAGIVASLLSIAKRGHVNGSIVLNLSQGGVRNVVVENVEEVEKK